MLAKITGAGVILLASVSFAHTQPLPIPVAPPPHSPLPAAPLHALVPYVGDESLQTELRLTPDQVKKLLALRQQTWDRTYTTASCDLKAKRTEWNDATTAATKEILNAEQLTRAEQLARRLIPNLCESLP